MNGDLAGFAPGDLVRVVRHGAVCWDVLQLSLSEALRVPGGTPGLVIELAPKHSTGLGRGAVRAIFGALGPRWIRRGNLDLIL